MSAGGCRSSLDGLALRTSNDVIHVPWLGDQLKHDRHTGSLRDQTARRHMPRVGSGEYDVSEAVTSLAQRNGGQCLQREGRRAVPAGAGQNEDATVCHTVPRVNSSPAVPEERPKTKYVPTSRKGMPQARKSTESLRNADTSKTTKTPVHIKLKGITKKSPRRRRTPCAGRPAQRSRSPESRCGRSLCSAAESIVSEVSV